MRSLQGIPSELRRFYQLAFLAGAFAAAVMGAVSSVLHAVGWTEMSFIWMLGYLVVGEATPGAWLVGLLWHLLNGGLFAVSYAAFFRKFEQYGWQGGLIYGLIHWIFAGLLLPAVAPAGTGIYAINLGAGDFLAFGLAHLIFGSIVGLYTDRAKDFLSMKPIQPLKKVA